MATVSRIPVRTCIGCKKKSATDALKRISFLEPDTLVIGADKNDGRGAWVCAKNRTCLEKALNPRILSKNLHKTISSGVVLVLEERL